MSRPKHPTVKFQIPGGNIKAYCHWYDLLTRIQQLPFEEEEYDDRPFEVLEVMKRKFRFSTKWLSKVQWETELEMRRTKLEMWRKLTDSRKDDLTDPFRQVKYFMHFGKKMGVYKMFANPENPIKNPISQSIMKSYSQPIRDYSKKREGADTRTAWPFNVFLYALVYDHQANKERKIFDKVIDILEKHVDKDEVYDYGKIQKHYKRIDPHEIIQLLKILSDACSKKGEVFIPADVSISEWPIDFLAYIAHHTGCKSNPYLTREKHHIETSDVTHQNNL